MRNLGRMAMALVAATVSCSAHGKAKMDAQEMTCGQEIAADAEVPEKLAKLIHHVASNMAAHADWVGADGRGKQEHDSLMAVAREYEAMADAAGRAAVAMQAMKDMPAAPHDPARLDRASQIRWMRAKINMQVEFAQMLTRHAEISRRVLAEMEGHWPSR
jgi:hypothetical protein